MQKQIIYYYQRGIASYLIAKKLGISNTQVRNILRRNNVPIRGHIITNKVSASRRTPEENRLITKAASESNKGSVHTQTHRVKLALSRQRNPKIDSVYEQPLVDMCRRLGIEVVPQKAFDKYNVDLYFVKENVVVEIFGGGFHNKKQAMELFHNKQRYLSKNKIPLVIVWADKLTYDPTRIIAVAQTCNGLCVVNGDGTPTTRGMGDIILNLDLF